MSRPFSECDLRPAAVHSATRGKFSTSPTNDELGLACFALVAQREREYHYAASDLIATYLSLTV